MRSTAGTVCGLITTLIYGAAIIGGIFYHNAYVKVYEYQHPGMGVRYSTDYFVTWIALICVAAVISAIHHALWTIIDNQLELHSELGKQHDMLEKVLEEIKEVRTGQASVPMQNNTAERQKLNTHPSALAEDSSRSWTCSNCGNVNTGSRCTQCGQIQN